MAPRNRVPSRRIPRHPPLPPGLSWFHRTGSIGSGLLLVLLLLVLTPPPIWAQGQGGDRRFRFETELGASVFFGNTQQVTFTNRSELSRADSTAEFSLGWDITYGEATGEDGVTFVNRRSWAAVTSVDLRPHARVSPFLFGTLEASLQKRIDRRFSGGAGAKLTFVDSDVALADLSAAALVERTVPLANGPTDPEVQARWSVRSRLRRSFDEDRLALTLEALYVPAFDDPGDFTFRGSSSVAFALSSVVSLKLSFVDAYDSGARARGARTNNDGQLLFSILSRF
jgi:hypothetical protein